MEYIRERERRRGRSDDFFFYGHIQTSLMPLVGKSSSPNTHKSDYSLAPTPLLFSSLFLAIHELSHNLAFSTPV